MVLRNICVITVFKYICPILFLFSSFDHEQTLEKYNFFLNTNLLTDSLHILVIYFVDRVIFASTDLTLCHTKPSLLNYILGFELKHPMRFLSSCQVLFASTDLIVCHTKPSLVNYILGFDLKHPMRFLSSCQVLFASTDLTVCHTKPSLVKYLLGFELKNPIRFLSSCEVLYIFII